MSKTNNDFDKANIDIESLRKKFKDGAFRQGFNLTDSLDEKVNDDFNQETINEIVLWKVNRYVTVYKSDWLKDFNTLKDVKELDGNEEKFVRIILKKMIETHGIRLPMASTMLRFRNPNIFQIIDFRTFRVIFGNDDDNEIKKKKLDANNDESINIYFDYLRRLRQYCKEIDIDFFEADRILYQYDIENKNFR